MALDIGSTLDGKYEIRKLLGEGAMGSVYEGEHNATGRRVAVKVISSADLTRDPKVVTRFQREARAAGAIDTQHITQVLDAGIDRDSGLPFLVMEFLAGEDLQHLIKRVGPLAPDLALRIMAQACLGLQKAHDSAVVHRDIKPHNLFLAKRDAGEVIVKLLDFGIAKVKMDRANETENAELTRTGNLLGSPLYMSPEQARGLKEIDLRTDIWSLGAVLYQALTGRTPYHHITALGQLILAICQEAPPSVQEFAPWVTPDVATIVHRCLQQDPNQRFQTAAELFTAIRPLLPYGWTIHEDMLVSLQDSARQQSAPRIVMSVPPPGMATQGTGFGTATGMPAVTAMGGSTTGALSQSQSQAVEKPQASKLPLILSAVAVVMVAGGGIYFATRPDPAPLPAQPQPTVTVVEAAPVPSPTPQPTAAPEKQILKFRVVVPKGVTAKLDEEPVKNEDGIVKVEGELGSVHELEIKQGSRTATAEIIITQEGPIPPNIDLNYKPPAKSTATATTTATPAPTLPAVKPGPTINTSTDEFGN